MRIGIKMKLTWTAVTALVLVGGVPAAAKEKTNVVLFVVDDMGWMDSAAYGSEYYETPNMERLAKQSMRFTDAYAVPLCSPTRCSILSGQHSARHGITSASGHQPAAAPDTSRYPEKASPAARFIYASSKNFVDPSIVTLAEVLRDAGYRTGHFGKWHLGLMPDKVKELDALIDAFIADTGALAPKPNPAYNPQFAKEAQVPSAGLVPKMCTVEMKNGALVVTMEPGKRNPFLGTAQIKTGRPLTLQLRARSQTGGPGKVQWKLAAQESFPTQGQVVNFDLPAGSEWRELSIDLPIEKMTQIVRLYLPLENGSVEIQSIDYLDAKTKKSVRRWEFQ